jgi:methyl-accepting chemotaxis protein
MFKKVLWPAIRLMGQLSYAAKFGLISFLFMVPLVILSGQIFNADYQSLKKTERELVAVYNIQEMMMVVYALEDYRNHAAPFVFQQDDGLKKKVLEYRTLIDTQLKQAMSQINNAELKEQLINFEKENFSSLGVDGESRMPTLSDQINYYQQVIDQLYLIINKYSQSTGLALDSDPAVQQLMLITLSNSPVIRNAAGVGYSAGIFAMIEQYLQSMTYDLMNDVFDLMSAAEPDIHLVTSSLESIGLDAIAEQAAQSGNGMIDIQMTIDEEIIAASNINMTWQEFQQY